MDNPEQQRPPAFDQKMDLNRPSIARIYDYLLGGYHNFEADRVRAHRSLEIYPDVALSAQVNRAFLRRAVGTMLDEGISQFIDVGSGIPTVGHVHEIAQKANPASRVVYVDIDPVAIAHSNALVGDDPNIMALLADARDPEYIFQRITEEAVLDLQKPIGVLMIALLHFIPDLQETKSLIGRYASNLVPGSYLAFTHGTYEDTPQGAAEGLMKMAGGSGTVVSYRRCQEIMGIFEGFAFMDPGIVFTPLWHPDSDEDLMLDEPGRALTYAGVARIGE